MLDLWGWPDVWGRRRSRVAVAVRALALACAVAGASADAAGAEQASAPASTPAGLLDAGSYHSCAGLAVGIMRCWGDGDNGQLGYGTMDRIGDDETPASVAPVNLGTGPAVRAFAAGDFHTCALLEDGTVHCWGFGADGRLGYGNPNNILDPSSAGPVKLGGRAKAISAGAAHTCAILEDGSVRCWGYGERGALGYDNPRNVGDTPTMTPDVAGPVKLGVGRTATAISAGRDHTCALLDGGDVRCWGISRNGRLGYYTGTADVGNTPNTTPDQFGPVNLGSGRIAMAIAAGGRHTCALLDDRTVRCWGLGASGQLGYGNTDTIGDSDTTTPNTVGPVVLGPGRTARAISAGDKHTCAILDDGSLRCWGLASSGRLGYPTQDSLGGQANIGDDETPGSAGPVDVGSGRTATAISAGTGHTCARLDDASVRCWGTGAYGRLGYCNQNSVGDDEAPGSVGPVNLEPGDGGALCPGSGVPVAAPADGAGPAAPPAAGGPLVTPPGPTVASRSVDPLAAASAVQAKRARELRRCRTAAARRKRRLRGAALKLCAQRYARTPGRVTALGAQASSSTKVVLTFAAPGSDGSQPPAARGYLVKQSRRPIRSARAFRRAQTLCKGDCRFDVTAVGAKLALNVTQLRPHSTYYYAITARDNVSGRTGVRSTAIRVRTG